jgi:hypothetical protein
MSFSAAAPARALLTKAGMLRAQGIARSASSAACFEYHPLKLLPDNPLQLLHCIEWASTLEDLDTQLQHPHGWRAMHTAAAVHTLAAIVADKVHRADGPRRLPEQDFVLASSLLARIAHLAAPLVPHYQLAALSQSMVALGRVSTPHRHQHNWRWDVAEC